MATGYGYDQDLTHVKFSDIMLEKCRLDPGIVSPTEYLGYPTQVTMILAVRKLAISDVEEEISILTDIILTWTNQCVKDLYDNQTLPLPTLAQSSDNYCFEYNKFWKPTVLLTTNTKGQFLNGDTFTKTLCISPSSGSFIVSYYGKVPSFCDLNLRNFPFDKQTCAIPFYVQSIETFVNLTQVAAFSDGKEKNSNWDVLKIYATIQSNIGYFHFVTQRKPLYILVNLFCPSILLMLLNFASFLIPPDNSDRSAFTAAIMLALFFLHSQVLSYLPESSSPILAAYFLLGEIIFATFLTIYSCLMCCLITFHNKRMNKTVSFLKILTKVRFFILIDFLMFWLSLVLFIIFTLIITIMMEIF